MRETPFTLWDLNQAIDAMDIPLVKNILMQQPELVRESDEEHDTPMCLLLSNPEITQEHPSVLLVLIKLLIDAGVDLNESVNHNGDRAIHYAIENGLTEVVLYLIQKGAEVEVSNRLRRTPMQRAIQSGNATLVLQLLRLGADLDFDAIYYAISSRSVVMVQTILAVNENIDDLGGRYDNLIDCAVEENAPDVAELLVRRGVTLGRPPKDASSLLHSAAYHESVDVIDFLLQHGARLDHVSAETGQSALQRAAFYGSLNVMEYLIKKGANEHATTSSGETLLHLAAGKNQIREIEWLLQRGADINKTNHAGFTPLAYAIYQGADRAAMTLARAHTPQELKRHLDTRLDERNGRAVKSIFSDLDAVYQEKISALDALNLLSAEEAKSQRVLRLAHVGFFSTCRNPADTTGLPLDIQLSIVKSQLETQHEACVRLNRRMTMCCARNDGGVIASGVAAWRSSIKDW